ncbi:MAG: DNA-binding domain-containing protein [Bacillota bacterium]|nr:MAG: DNA-binding domain-containing protein [Bacillota bacterium]
MSYVEKVRAALDFITLNLREDIKVEDVARAVHFSVSHFHSIFHRVVGSTLAAYVRCRRLNLAALDLALSRKRIIDIAVEYRFESQETFTRAFKRHYDVTPSRFRKHELFSQTMSRMGPLGSRDVIKREVQRMEKDRTPVFSGDADSSTRLVLDGVMRVGFYDGGDQCPEDIPFPSCMASVLRYLGEEYPWAPLESHKKMWRLNMANVDILGKSGMAFGLLWREGWHPDNADMMFVADPREVIHRAFKAVGYDYEIIQKTGNKDDEVNYRTKILESIRRGVPVLGYGVIGPPECCLITGYDEVGDVLIGWNFFQHNAEFSAGVDFEPSGYFRKRNWFRDTWSLIVIGEKHEHKQGQEVKDLLEWAVSIARTPMVLGRHSGLAAYAAWAKQILNDVEFNTDDPHVLQQWYGVHNSAVGIVAECRHWAASFLRSIAESNPELCEELFEAAQCYQEEHELMWKIWGLVGSNWQPEAHLRFAASEVRQKSAELILKARDIDEHAATVLERLVERL